MNDNLPPLPPCAPEFKPRWSTDPGRYNKDQMQAYARAAIERQSVPQPQPVQPEGPMATTVEQAARDVAKCLNERDGQGLDLRHVAMLAHYAQQPVQEPVARVKFSDDAFDSVDWIPYQGQPLKDGDLLFTSPQAQPQPVQEPVYQYQCANGSWVDQTKESYDYNVRNGWATVRVLYTSPQIQGEKQ